MTSSRPPQHQPADPLDDLKGHEAQSHVALHLQVRDMKPCVARYLALDIMPEVGNRSRMFNALAAELRRCGEDEARTEKIMLDYYRRLPLEIPNAPGRDGRPFTETEVKWAVASAFRPPKPKTHGCRNGFWEAACVGQESCEFHRLLSGGGGNRASHDFAPWLGARDAKTGKKLLTDGDVRVYIALEVIERIRGFRPGSMLFVSHRELARVSGIGKSNVGAILERLFWHGLIAYKKGAAQSRRWASEIRRVIPVPKPGKWEPVLHLDVPYESPWQDTPLPGEQDDEYEDGGDDDDDCSDSK